MDTVQPSFIPHDAKVAQKQKIGGRAGLADLLLLIGVVLVIASVALAAGVLLYQQYLASSNTSKLSQLQRAEAAFEPSLVKQLQRLDDRMNAGSQLLQVHLAPTALFTTLEQTTISSIQFTSLTIDATDRAHITLKMTGVADSVNSVALQSDLFSKSGAIQSAIFSNIDRQSDGVHFDLSALVNPASLNYGQLVTGQSATNQLPAQTAQSGAQGSASAATTNASSSNQNPFGAIPSGTQAK